MEELRQTALAYYQDAPEDMRSAVDHFFQEMDPDAKDRVSRQDFLEYMKMDEDCAHMSNHSFFDVLKTEESEGLDFMDVLTLLYIRYSRRPFCNGECKTFIKGSYFTCVKCYDNSTDTFNVCAACYLNDKYVHRQHKKFLDNYLLSEAKRREALSLKLQQEASSIINGSKAHESVGAKDLKKKLQSSSGSRTVTLREANAASSPKPPTPEPSSPTSNAPEGSNRSTSNALVPVNPKPKHRSSAGKNAIKAVELALALGNIFVTSTASQCVIL